MSCVVGVYITHICVILALIAGTIKTLFGYVGTAGIFEKQETDTYYNWKKEKYQKLPFTIRVEKLDVHYWPTTIEAEIVGAGLPRPYKLKEGDEVFYQGDRIVFANFLPDSIVANNEVYSISKSLHDPAVLFKIYRDDGKGTARRAPTNYWVFAKDAGYQNKVLPPYSIRVLSNQYLVKSSESLLSIIEDGKVKLREVVRPNKSVDYKGLHICFWGFDQDVYRNYFTGLQITYDPGLWLMWIALGGILCGVCVVFC